MRVDDEFQCTGVAMGLFLPSAADNQQRPCPARVPAGTEGTPAASGLLWVLPGLCGVSCLNSAAERL